MNKIEPHDSTYNLRNSFHSEREPLTPPKPSIDPFEKIYSRTSSSKGEFSRRVNVSERTAIESRISQCPPIEKISLGRSQRHPEIPSHIIPKKEEPNKQLQRIILGAKLSNVPEEQIERLEKLKEDIDQNSNAKIVKTKIGSLLREISADPNQNYEDLSLELSALLTTLNTRQKELNSYQVKQQQSLPPFRF